MRVGFWTFVMGVAAGAAAALIFAPQSGEEARKLIANKARRGIGQSSKAVQSAAARGANVLQGIKEQAAEAVATDKKAYSRAASAAE